MRTRLGTEVFKKIHLAKVPKSLWRCLWRLPPSLVDIARYFGIPTHTTTCRKGRAPIEELVEFDRNQVPLLM
jgi:hypothetical protein